MHERKESVEAVMARLRPKLNSDPNLRAFLQNPPSIRIGGSLTKSLYQYTLLSGDTATLYKSIPGDGKRDGEDSGRRRCYYGFAD